ncbi:MAG: magnesium-translocating P-type ATPase, partial [Christensenellaceae bacterium]|nr:magnesium-translocating P-type ATPase [Christensenellaceae bacterium]
SDIFSRTDSSPEGLTQEQAEAHTEEHGANVITAGNRNTVFHRLWSAVVNPFNIVLIIIAIVSLFMDVIFSSKPDYVTVIIIFSLVVLSSGVAFVQSQRSNAAAEKLKKMISNTATVLRDGAFVEISMSEITVGDIVKLSAGDMLPADIRFLTTKDTFVAQAALTGESAPVEKFGEAMIRGGESVTGLPNIGFMGANIISGSATAVVIAVGNDTYFGSMAKSLSGDRAKNSFERGVGSVSSLLIRLMVIMVPVVLLINGFTKKDWASALLFAVSVAVGLTPEMLPVVMATTLAKGAVAMSKHKVIVKTLGAIQTFGEMDILCTDKTGTLTDDKIILEKYLSPLGEDDERVLAHAYRNSFFQTGLKNLMDMAIINRAEVNGLRDSLKRFTRVDEIPFDFVRRRMSVVLSDGTGKRQLITKGAVDEILSICTYVEIEGKILPFGDEMRAATRKTYEKHNTEGLRVIAVAQKNEVPAADIFGVKDEAEMVLIGFVGFLDPPKESAKTAIEGLRQRGIRSVVLTGDSEGVAVRVCEKVGIATSIVQNGNNVENLSDEELREAVKTCDLFAKLSPNQKERVVKAFQANGHTVGYMGDGINDAPPLHAADVGISVDNAVDIAKETADIILLKKDLNVLIEGVVEGRKTFGNIVKYIKMAASGNFGNMISVVVASIFLPFLPMLPVHILVQNLLSDFSQMGIPFDSVDKEYLQKPRKWETRSIKSFMWVLGPISSIFDILCFIVLWFAILPKSGLEMNSPGAAALFQCGWFVFGTVSQVLVIHMIRTSKLPFIKSKPSRALLLSTLIIAVVAVVIGFTKVSIGIDLTPLPVLFVPYLVVLLVLYIISAQLIKKLYVKKFGGWL